MNMGDFFNQSADVEKTVEKYAHSNCTRPENQLNLQLIKSYVLCPLSMKE